MKKPVKSENAKLEAKILELKAENNLLKGQLSEVMKKLKELAAAKKDASTRERHLTLEECRRLEH